MSMAPVPKLNLSNLNTRAPLGIKGTNLGAAPASSRLSCSALRCELPPTPHRPKATARAQPATEPIRVMTRIHPAGSDAAFPALSSTFDAALGCRATDEETYATVGRPLLQHALQGYRCALLMYGQTGSGKTHTMGNVFGGLVSELFEATRGGFPLSNNTSVQGGPGCESLPPMQRFEVTVGAIEIYKNDAYDLLNNREKLPSIARNLEAVKMSMTGGPKGQTFVTVSDGFGLEQVLQEASSTRMVGATNANAHSSRSHAVYHIILREVRDENNNMGGDEDFGENDSFGSPGMLDNNSFSFNSNQMPSPSGAPPTQPSALLRVGHLKLIDLAGSESLKVSGNRAREKEAIEINAGLSTLRRLLWAMAGYHRAVQKSNSNRRGGMPRGTRVLHSAVSPSPTVSCPPLPIRESELTASLHDCFVGNSRVTFVATLCGTAAAAKSDEETLKVADDARCIVKSVEVNFDKTNAETSAAVKKLTAELEASQSLMGGMWASLLAANRQEVCSAEHTSRLQLESQHGSEVAALREAFFRGIAELQPTSRRPRDPREGALMRVWKTLEGVFSPRAGPNAPLRPTLDNIDHLDLGVSASTSEDGDRDAEEEEYRSVSAVTLSRTPSELCDEALAGRVTAAAFEPSSKTKRCRSRRDEEDEEMKDEEDEYNAAHHEEDHGRRSTRLHSATTSRHGSPAPVPVLTNEELLDTKRKRADKGRRLPDVRRDARFLLRPSDVFGSAPKRKGARQEAPQSDQAAPSQISRFAGGFKRRLFPDGEE